MGARVRRGPQHAAPHHLPARQVSAPIPVLSPTRDRNRKREEEEERRKYCNQDAMGSWGARSGAARGPRGRRGAGRAGWMWLRHVVGPGAPRWISVPRCGCCVFFFGGLLSNGQWPMATHSVLTKREGAVGVDAEQQAVYAAREGKKERRMTGNGRLRQHFVVLRLLNLLPSLECDFLSAISGVLSFSSASNSCSVYSFALACGFPYFFLCSCCFPFRCPPFLLFCFPFPPPSSLSPFLLHFFGFVSLLVSSPSYSSFYFYIILF